VLISAIEHYAYCPRQCALIHLDSVFEDNVHTTRGTLAHARVDSGASSFARGQHTLRSLPLWSDRYQLRGRADAVEFHNNIPYPIEYKTGKRHSTAPDLQVCAQALCLEEMLDITVPAGAIYYAAQRKRHKILFTPALRKKTLETAEKIRAMLSSAQLPNAPADQRCRACSLRDTCLPQTVTAKSRLDHFQTELFEVNENNNSDA